MRPSTRMSITVDKRTHENKQIVWHSIYVWLSQGANWKKFGDTSECYLSWIILLTEQYLNWLASNRMIWVSTTFVQYLIDVLIAKSVFLTILLIEQHIAHELTRCRNLKIIKNNVFLASKLTGQKPKIASSGTFILSLVITYSSVYV